VETVTTIAEKLNSADWHYAEQDVSALGEIARRVAAVGRAKDLITYSKLVEGIVFRLRTVSGGQPIALGVPDWIDLHRAILGSFLGRLCLATYERGGFMGSALVVSATGLEPSEGFRDLMRQLGLPHNPKSTEYLAFWTHEVATAHAWYSANEW
jgi:hypothetical protein